MEQNKCIWLNQKKQPCPWQAISTKCCFCKRHSIYDGIYTADDIPTLSFCAGCKNLFKPLTNEIKQCCKCHDRGEMNRNKTKDKRKHDKKICSGITIHNTPCTNYSMDNNEYCKKHESYGRWKGLTDNGHNVCKNWIRGCFEIIDTELKSCMTCRNKEQILENKRNNLKKSKAIEFNSNNNDITNSNNKPNTLMCIDCNKIDDTTKMTNNKCLNCYNAYKKNEMNRNTPNPIVNKLKHCKKSAKDRNIEWELTNEFAINLIRSKCYYCDKLVAFNGLDRIDSNKNYTEDNCVACCKKCNIMKNTHSVNEFLNIITYVLSVNLQITTLPNMEHNILFEFSQHGTYGRFITDAKRRDINSELTEEIYNYTVSQPCAYCKNSSSLGSRGIDRINSSMPYIIGNITPCCKTCNYLKNELSVNDFYEHLKQIYNFKILKINNSDVTIKEQILSLCKNVKTIKQEKFYNVPEFYDNLMFKSQDIDSIKNIKIGIEFVNNKNQQDIWNYYRRTVSSLKKIDNAKLIGRQIYILVKDLTTQKYLGIISLSSDIYNLEQRDNFIKWNFADKKDKLGYIMNMSTCVPLQPFGFNFNGGKLLASLVFSKEVLIHFRDKYNNELLGITTTSLYGKSIQYDRLKCLKFIGYTKGNSVKDIPSEVTKLCANYIKEEYNQNYPLRKKFIIIQSAFNKLNISKEDLLNSNKKGIYFGYTCKDSSQFLNGITDICPNLCKYENINTAEQIYQWWLNRWAIQRFTHLHKT